MKKNKFIFTIFFIATLFFNPNFIFAQDSNDDFVIEVRAKKIEQSVAEQKITITQDEIEKSKAENLCTLLQNKGIQILSYGPYGLESKPSIRGFTDETVRVVIDGVCVNNPQYGTFDFSSIDINQIEKIEILKGGFSENANDEGAVGGAIYITTKKFSTKKQFISDTSLKTFFNMNFPVDTAKESLSLSLPIDNKNFVSTSASFCAAKNLYLFKNYKNQISQRENSSVWDSTVALSYSHFFDKGFTLSASDQIYAGNKNCPGVENSATPGLQKDYNNRFIFNFSNPNIKNIFSFENNFAFLTSVRFYDSATENSEHILNDLTYAANINFFGTDFFNQQISFNFGADFLQSTDDGNHNQFSYTLKSNSKFYLPYDWSFTLPLAIKFQGQNFSFIPKFGVNKKFYFGEFIFDLYRMNQFPNMDDLFWTGSGAKGNPDLSPENGWGGEIVFNSFLDFLPISLSIFSNYYENKIQWATKDGNWQPQNIASAFYAGIDFNFSKTFFNGILGIKFNCEYLYTRLLDKNNSITYGKKIMWTPDFVASLVFDLNLNDWIFSIDANYTGLRYISNLNVSYLKPYILLNASASFHGFKIAKPYLKFENILFQNYQSVENYPMPLISMTAGVKLKIEKGNSQK